MKKAFTVLALCVVALANVARADIPLVSFGTDQFSMTTNTFTFGPGNQTATSYEVFGSDFGSEVFGNVPTVEFTGGDLFQLKFTAIVVGNANTDFQIRLYDSNNNFMAYKGNFTEFTSTAEMTVTLGFDFESGAFNNNVTAVRLQTAGSGTGYVDMKMETVSAESIPEPSSYALFGVGLVFLLSSAVRRQLVLRSQA